MKEGGSVTGEERKQGDFVFQGSRLLTLDDRDFVGYAWMIALLTTCTLQCLGTLASHRRASCNTRPTAAQYVDLYRTQMDTPASFHSLHSAGLRVLHPSLWVWFGSVPERQTDHKGLITSCRTRRRIGEYMGKPMQSSLDFVAI
jgi:hypothetical protein